MSQRRRAKRADRPNPREDRNININVIPFNPKLIKRKKVDIIPRNLSQEKYVDCIESSRITFGIGPAGTGKSYLTTLLAIKALEDGMVDKIIITRPAVSVDEQHGFLPGTLLEKMAPWTRPIFDIFQEYYHPTHIERMVEDGVIEVSPLAFMRGRTFKNSFIIGDEFQNCTVSQVKMCLTRIGENSKMVVTGDLRQHDRGFEDNGLKDFIHRLGRGSANISVVHFTEKDIERDPIVSEVLKIYGEE